MAANFKNMSKAQRRTYASDRFGRTIPDHANANDVLIDVLRLPPRRDPGNVETTNGNITRFEDAVHANHTDSCTVVETYLSDLGSYNSNQRGSLSGWLTVNCPQLFPEHCWSHGPSEDGTEYWITISGEDANVQWIFN